MSGEKRRKREQLWDRTMENTTRYLQLHVSHAAADGVDGAAVVQSRVALGQVVDHQMSLSLLVVDFITIRFRKSHELLQQKESRQTSFIKTRPRSSLL